MSKYDIVAKSKDQSKSHKNSNSNAKPTEQSDNEMYFYMTFVWKQC